MATDINQFWTLLSESQLVSAPELQALFAKFSSKSSGERTVTALSGWLVAQKAVSPYQAKLLSAGFGGPFRYGNYTLVDRIDAGPIASHFEARHTKTGYHVLLQFLAGTEPIHLTQWKAIESLVDRISAIEHPNLVETYETVVSAEHRFVVSQLPAGVSLSQKLPYKSRLPWERACKIFAQVARGLEQLHQRDVAHGAISLSTIYRASDDVSVLLPNVLPPADEDSRSDKKGFESKFDYLAPETYTSTFDPTSSDAKLSDIYSLGCAFQRAISGRSVFGGEDIEAKKKLHASAEPPTLEKYEVPVELQALLKTMLAKKPSDRPKSAREVATILALHAGLGDESSVDAIPDSEQRKAYLKTIRQFFPARDVEQPVGIPSFEVEAGAAQEMPIETVSVSDFVNRGGDSKQRDRDSLVPAKPNKRRWGAKLAIAAMFLAMVGIAGMFVFELLNSPIEEAPTPVVADSPDITPKNLKPNDGEPGSKIASLPIELTPTVTQELIEDDRQSLWETPTTGPPIDFSCLPVNPKLIFVFRPAELLQTDQGPRLLKSLGPAFEPAVQRLVSLCGVELTEVAELIVSLHTSDDFEYQPFFLIRTVRALEIGELLDSWGQPTQQPAVGNRAVYRSGNEEFSYCIVQQSNSLDEASEESAEDSPENRSVSQFAVANWELVDEVAASELGALLSGSLRKMAQWTDRERHVNILFTRTGLFNDEGQQLMGEQLKTLNRELRILIPDEVRGGLLSLHVDDGNYVELMLDKSVDLKATDLKDDLAEKFRVQRDSLTRFVTAIPPSPYWDAVRQKYDNMLTDFNRRIRWGVERGEVVANAWLPPMAAHNLLAASELVTAFSSGSATVVESINAGPQSLAELLEIKRDLNIANPPDLNVLLADLQNEVSGDVGTLPFEFNIRLIGADLQKEGITKNQRPSALVIEQKSLSEILTLIMTAANPSQDITGPSDPNCKLVWVIGPDPENPDVEAILVTTRAAAAEKSYTLPRAFRLE